MRPRSHSQPGEQVTLLVVVTHGVSARYLMRGQLVHLGDSGLRVIVTAAPGPDLDWVARHYDIEVEPIAMDREISPVRDLTSLVRMIAMMRRVRPDIVSAGTTKAGLLGMLASRALGVEHRVYVLRGLRLETLRGLKRWIMSLTELVASACAHRVVCVSESLRSRYVTSGFTSERKAVVLGAGSSNGVDTERFFVTGPEDRRESRLRFGVPEAAPVIGFVGRFTRDKGIADLVQAYVDVVLPAIPGARLVLVGDFEDGDPVSMKIRRTVKDHPGVVEAGFLKDTSSAYHAFDVFAFPSYREGFPNAPLEAAACGVPTVGYRATGTVDAVVDGETGQIVDRGDAAALADSLVRYLGDGDLRERHGRAARRRVEQNFQNLTVWENWAAFYQALAGERREEPTCRNESAV